MYLQINGCTHYVETYGQGDPIMFLHGLYMDHTIWLKQVDNFSKFHQVILYDQRGYGKTEKGDRKVTFLQLADDLKEIADVLQLNSPVLVGYSTAGAIVLNALSRYPKLAKQAVVTGAFADMRGGYLQLNQKIGLISAKKKWKRLTAVLFALNHATNVKEFRVFVQSVMRSDQQAVKEILYDMSGFDISRNLKSVQSPVLLLYGSREHFYYRQELLDIVHHAPHLQLHFIKGVRHATMTKTAGQFYEQVKNFLDSTRVST